MKLRMVALGSMLVSAMVLAQDAPDGGANASGKLPHAMRMQDELGLTDEQVAKMRAIRDGGGTREDMQAVLTPEQRAKVVGRKSENRAVLTPEQQARVVGRKSAKQAALTADTRQAAVVDGQQLSGAPAIAAKMASAVSRASAGVSGGMNPVMALAMPGVNDPAQSAVRQALREAAKEVTGEALTGEAAFTLELLLIQWLTGLPNASNYPPRARQVTKALLMDWQTAQTPLKTHQTQLTLVLLSIVFQDDLWEGTEWKDGNPERALARLKGLPLDAVTKWAISANIPQFEFAAANSLVGVDELFIDEMFQTSLFETALPIAPEAIGKSTTQALTLQRQAKAAALRKQTKASIQTELGLSDEQMKKMEEIRKNYGSQEEMRAVLTPEQQAKFDDMRSKRSVHGPAPKSAAAPAPTPASIPASTPAPSATPTTTPAATP